MRVTGVMPLSEGKSIFVCLGKQLYDHRNNYLTLFRFKKTTQLSLFRNKSIFDEVIYYYLNTLFD